MEKKSYEICPFCGEQDFDLIGLKDHLLSGKCDIFEETPKAWRPRRQTGGFTHDTFGGNIGDLPTL